MTSASMSTESSGSTKPIKSHSLKHEPWPERRIAVMIACIESGIFEPIVPLVVDYSREWTLCATSSNRSDIVQYDAEQKKWCTLASPLVNNPYAKNWQSFMIASHSGDLLCSWSRQVVDIRRDARITCRALVRDKDYSDADHACFTLHLEHTVHRPIQVHVDQRLTRSQLVGAVMDNNTAGVWFLQSTVGFVCIKVANSWTNHSPFVVKIHR